MDITSLLQIPLLQLLGFGLVIVILQKLGIDIIGLVKMLFNKNGEKRGNGNEAEVKLKTIESNHLPHLEIKVDDLLKTQQEILFILKDFKEDGIKLKK